MYEKIVLNGQFTFSAYCVSLVDYLEFFESLDGWPDSNWDLWDQKRLPYHLSWILLLLCATVSLLLKHTKKILLMFAWKAGQLHNRKLMFNIFYAAPLLSIISVMLVLWFHHFLQTLLFIKIIIWFLCLSLFDKNLIYCLSF